MEFITAYDAFNKQRQIHFEVINQELDKIISEIDQTIQNNPKDNHIITIYISCQGLFVILTQSYSISTTPQSPPRDAQHHEHRPYRHHEVISSHVAR